MAALASREAAGPTTPVATGLVMSSSPPQSGSRFREAHSLTLNVFEINQETSLLLDLCQQTYTIGAIIEAVERQLQETSLADDILGMLGALQEQQIIGGVHG